MMRRCRSSTRRSSPPACPRWTRWMPRSIDALEQRRQPPGARAAAPARGAAQAEQAELLQASEKDAGLLVERLGFLHDGRAIEFTQSFYRGDTYDFVAELSCRARERRRRAHAQPVQRSGAGRRPSCANSCGPIRRLCTQLGERLRAAAAARSGHLRARQLRSCGHLRPLSDRDAPGRADLIGRAVGEFGVSRLDRTCRAPSCSRSRSPAPALICWPWCDGARAAGAYIVALVNAPALAAGASSPMSCCRCAAGRGTQRRGHEILHRLA